MNKTKKILLGTAFILALVVLVALLSLSFAELIAESREPLDTTAAIAVNGSVTTTAPTPATSDAPATLQPTVSEAPHTTEAPVTTDAPVISETPYDSITVSTLETNQGSLIAIDREHPYTYRASSLYTPAELDRFSESELAELGYISLYKGKSNLYLLRSRLIFLRTEAYQGFLMMMSDYVAKSGNRDVQVRFGYQLVSGTPDLGSLSDERVSGLVVELNVYTSAGTFSIDHVSKKSAYYDWFYANAYRYGFILTGESGLLRYVGTPNAEYMHRNELDLSRYLELLSGYSFERPLTFVDNTGILWKLYTVAASSSSLTEIKLPKESVYSISGNNMGGFVVQARAK